MNLPTRLLFLAPLMLTRLPAQGPLTPPGAPVPGMKTLQQIEPRTPISSVPFIITQSGSYYLTQNVNITSVTGGISIETSNVTLDLNGFTISGNLSATSAAIRVQNVVPTPTSIHIRNGVIKGPLTVSITGNWPSKTWTQSPATGGFLAGVDAGVSSNCSFTDLTITGCRQMGLSAGSRSIIRYVTACGNGTGIDLSPNYASSVVEHCVAGENMGLGIDAGMSTVSHCAAELNGAEGISADNGTIAYCSAWENKGTGIRANLASVSFCSALNNGRHGIDASSGVLAFCKSATNNRTQSSWVDLDASGATRTGNNPTP